MTHLNNHKHITQCNLLQVDNNDDETVARWLRLGFKLMPEADVVADDRAAVDCKKCIDSMIGTDDHTRWNSQFFGANKDGNLATVKTGFVDPEPEHYQNPSSTD